MAFSGKSLTILDIGGRYQPYRPLFQSSARYIAVDLIHTKFVSVVANGEALPFAPATFDLVIATQVFEYFRDPVAAARGIHVALKPGGTLLGSFAGFAPRFSMEERWRFTSLGLQQIFEPFEIVEIVPELRSAESLIRTFNIATETFVRHRLARRLHRLTLCPVLNLIGLAAQKLSLMSGDQFTSNFSVKAVKAS